MNISILQYRARIGLYNNIRYKGSGLCQSSNSNRFTSIYDSLDGMAPAAGTCLSYILFIVCILNYALYIFEEYIMNHPTTTLTGMDKTMASHTYNLTGAAIVYRIIISCIFTV